MGFDWRREFSRDLMALGSPLFLILVLVRIWIADNYLQLFQIVLSVVLLGGIWLIYRKLDFYSAIIVIAGVFTSLFYMERDFTIFVAIAGVIGLFGMYKYLGRRGTFIGAILGAVVSGISYFVSRFTGIVNL
jgi:hypothetical protein